MNKHSLNQAVWDSFEIDQNYFHEYIIKGSTIDGEQCLIEKQKGNKWLMSFNGVPKFILNTKTVVAMLRSANTILV